MQEVSKGNGEASGNPRVNSPVNESFARQSRGFTENVLQVSLHDSGAITGFIVSSVRRIKTETAPSLQVSYPVSGESGIPLGS